MARLNIKCKEATALVLKKESSSLPLQDRFRLWMHLIICSWCRLFVKQNRMLHTAMSQEGPHVKLDPEFKKKIEESLGRGGSDLPSD